jgi:hypothetical protein
MKVVDKIAVQSVVRWFEQAVLGLNLCPFASRPYEANAIEFEISLANNDEHCLIDLFLNLQRLDQEPDVETIVLIFPHHLVHFEDYNQFLSLADNLLENEGWEGTYQIASFHPDYQFEGTSAQDRANWTNRSPYPILHLLREASISRFSNSAAGRHDIPERNIQTLETLSDQNMKRIFHSSSAV